MLGSLLMSGRNLGTCELFELPLDRHDRCTRVEPGELRQADLGQRAANRGVETLPGATGNAVVFEAAIPRTGGTIREGDRSFQGAENGRGADSVRWPGQLVSAVRATRGIDQAGAVQLLQQLGDR